MEQIIMIFNVACIILSVISIIVGVLFLVAARDMWNMPVYRDWHGKSFEAFIYYLVLGICALWLGVMLLLYAIGIFPLSEWKTWGFDE